ELGARKDHDRHLRMVVRGQAATLQQVLQDSEHVEGFEIDESAGPDLQVRVTLGSDVREQLVAQLVEAGLGLRQLGQARSELERVFLQLTAGAQPQPPASKEGAAA
ncbi:MAG: hypothetical protein AB1Z98_01500, partial [Nannocystaceae bacterium]